MSSPVHRQVSSVSSLSPVVRLLIVAFSLTFILQQTAGDGPPQIFGLIPHIFWNQHHFWQLGSYLFLHHSLLQLFINLLALYIFGCQLEKLWGSWFFLKFSLICGGGAGLTTLCFNPSGRFPILGASGAILGMMVAHAFYHPSRNHYLSFLVPVKVRYLVFLYSLLVFYASIAGTPSPLAYLSQVGGMVAGMLYLNFYSLKHLILREKRRQRAKIIRKRYRVVDGGKSIGGT